MRPQGDDRQLKFDFSGKKKPPQWEMIAVTLECGEIKADTYVVGTWVVPITARLRTGK
jgi:hypothetical protein